MSVKHIICRIILCLAAVTPLSYAQVSEPDKTDISYGNDLSAILKRGKLRVGIIGAEWPPYMIHPHSEKPSGLDAVITDDIGRNLGVDIEYVPCSKYWDEMIESLSTGYVDMAISEISITLARERIVNFTIPYLNFHDALAIDRLSAKKMGLLDQHGKFRIPEKGQGLTIGTVGKTAYAHAFFDRIFPLAEKKLYNSLADGFDAMQKRQIGLFYYNETFIWQMMQDKPELALYYTVTTSSHNDPIAIAVAPGKPHLLRWLNLYIANTIPSLTQNDVSEWYESGMTNDILHKPQPFNTPVAITGHSTRLHSLLAWTTQHKNILFFVFGLGILLLLVSFFVPEKMRHLSIERLLRLTVRLLRNRFVFLLGIVGGILFGITFREAAQEWLQKPAQVFLAALHMCALPFIFSAVTGSMARLVQHGKARFYTLRIGLKLVYTILIATILVTILAAAVPFNRFLTREHSENLGRIVLDHEDALINVSHTQPVSQTDPFFPGNIIRAMFYDNMLAILAFSALLGLALGCINSSTTRALLHGLDGMYEGIQLIVNWVLVLLPPGLFCLLGYSMSLHETWVLAAMSGYIVAFYTITLAVMGILLLLMALRLKTSPWRLATALKQSFTVAFASGSPYATIPVALEELKNTSINSRNAAAVLPLSFAFCDVKKMLIFALSIFFFAALYHVPLNHSAIWHMIPVSILLISLQTSGMRSAIYLPFIGLLLTPFDIPAGTALTLLFVVYPLIDPIGSVLNLVTGIAITASLPGINDATSFPTAPQTGSPETE